MVGILFLLMSLVDASQFQWAITEQFSSSSCAIADLTKTQELGRVGTVALGLGCGDSSAKAYVVQGTDLVTESHSTADCSGTPLANSTTMLDTCAESSTAGVYEKTKVVTLPATSTTVYNQGDDNCSNSHLGIYVGALELCHFDSNVPGKKSRKTVCQGDKTWNCYYSNSDCTGDDFCSPSSNTLNSCYETGGRYAITTVLGSSSEIASICPTTTTTTTTPFTGISGNISVYGDGTCSTLTGTYPVNLGQCMPTGAGTQKWECSAGSISHLTYATADCSGIVVTNGPYEQGPCVPQDNGTSSWLLDFAGCTSTPISSSKGQLFSLTILGFACNLVAG